MTKFCFAAMFAGLMASAAQPACAESATARWDTFFYEHPAANAGVTDEVPRETSLDVQSCENGWCRVRYGQADGYVREEVVHGAGNALDRQGSSTDAACFTAAQPGGKAWQAERFCRSGP